MDKVTSVPNVPNVSGDSDDIYMSITLNRVSTSNAAKIQEMVYEIAGRTGTSIYYNDPIELDDEFPDEEDNDG